MICPYCDSLLEEKTNTHNCSYCGAPLGAFLQREMPAPPLGVYKRPFGFLEVQEKGLRFYDKFLNVFTDRFVPYEDIVAVRYVPGGEKLDYLSVRERGSQDIPWPTTDREAIRDQTSVGFGSYMNERYERIYKFLQVICRMNR